MVALPTLPTIPALPTLPTDPAGLTSFLTNGLSQTAPNIPTGSIQSGYISSMLDGMNAASKRIQSINSNSILDASQMENDPNFSRTNPINQQSLTANVSKLGLSTQSLTAGQALSAMSSISEIIPSGVRSTLMNLQSLGASAGSKLLQLPSLLTQGAATWESALTKDLNSLFGTSLSFTQIAAMAAAVAGVLIAAPAVANTGVSNVLPLTLQQTTPADVTAVATSADMQTTLAATSLTTDQQAAFTAYLTAQLTTFSSTPVSSLVTAENFQSTALTMDDPLGVAIRYQLQSQIQISYNQFLAETVVNSGFFTNQIDVQSVFDVLATDAQSNITQGFTGKLGLPSLSLVVNAVKSENKNFVINAFNNAFNNIAKTTISAAGLNQPTDPTVKPVDYLQNIKKNIEARIQIQQTGATQAQLNTYDSFLKTVIASGDVSPAAISQLNDELNSLLKLSIEVC